MWSKEATSAQMSYLDSLYQPAIGYCKTRWYLERLKQKHVSKGWAAREISRLLDIKRNSGATAAKPMNWENIEPSDDELKAFWAEYLKRPGKLVVEEP